MAAAAAVPATFAARFEAAKALRDDHAVRFAALRAAPTAKKRSPFIECFVHEGTVELTVVEEVKETPIADLLAAGAAPLPSPPSMTCSKRNWISSSTRGSRSRR